jgi:hypothetical protein
MRSHHDGTSPRVSTAPNAFDPAFLARVQEDDNEPLTAAEADLAGPWKVEWVPGHPGAVAVLREWESLDKGDLPEAVFVDPEIAELCAAGLSLVEREPLFSLQDQLDPAAPVCPGHPVTAVFGEQGPAVCGWLRRYHPGVTAVLHVLEGLASPVAPPARRGQRRRRQRSPPPGRPSPGRALGSRGGRPAGRLRRAGGRSATARMPRRSPRRAALRAGALGGHQRPVAPAQHHQPAVATLRGAAQHTGALAVA